MGYAESHNHLARVLEKIFPERKNLWTYLDDVILTHNGTWEEAVDDIIVFLSRLHKHGLKLSPKKANFFKEHVVFLGFLLQRGTISIPDERIQGFLEVPPPTDRLALRKFLNSLGFFRTNIPNFSELSFELSELVNNSDKKKIGHIPFQFTETHQVLFDKLKDATRRSLPLYEVDFSKPVYCFSDASKRSISFVAFQMEVDDTDWFNGSKMDDVQRTKKISEAVMSKNGPKKKFVFCSSRKLTKSERNYSIFKLELVSCVHGLLSAKTLFSFASVKMFVDSKSLLFVRLCKSSSEQVARLAILLSSFDIDLFHVPSEVNFLSDYLSRLPTDNTQPSREEEPRLLTEKESSIILNHLVIPDNLTIPCSIARILLNEESLRVNF